VNDDMVPRSLVGGFSGFVLPNDAASSSFGDNRDQSIELTAARKVGFCRSRHMSQSVDCIDVMRSIMMPSISSLDDGGDCCHHGRGLLLI
jgi:hypothetical protein